MHRRHHVTLPIRIALTMAFAMIGLAAHGQTSFRVGESFTVGDSTLRPAAWRQINHDVASLGDVSYVVWADTRSGEGSQIRGTLIRGDGVVTPRSGTLLSTPGLGYYIDPLIVADGDLFFVVWHAPSGHGRSWGRLIDREGNLVGEPIDLGTPVQFRRIMAASGSGFLALEQQLLTHVAPDGSVTRLPVSELDSLNVLSAASLGDDFILIASDYVTTEETFVRITPGGVFETTTIDVERGNERIEMIESGGELYVVVGSSPIRIFRIDLEAATSTPVDVPSTAPGGSLWWMKSGEDGSLLFAWEDRVAQAEERQIIAMHFDPRDSSHTVRNIELLGRHPILAPSGDDLRLFFLTGPDDGFDIVHTRVGSDLRPFDEPTVLTWAQPAQSSPSATASSTGGVGIVWEEEREGRLQIAYTVSTSSGTIRYSSLLEPSPVPQFEPVIASDRSGFLVVWRSVVNDEPSVLARRIAADGTLLDETPILLGTVASDVNGAISVVWNGSDYLVAVVQHPYPYEIRVVRVSADGSVDLSPGLVARSERHGRQTRPAMAAAHDGTVLLVWQDGDDSDVCRITCPQPVLGAIRGVRIDRNGAFLDPVPMTISTDDEIQRRPSVAASGEIFLVAWERASRVRATRVTTAGAVLDHDQIGHGVTLPGLIVGRPAVAALDISFLVSWTDTSPLWGTTNHLLGVEIGPEGFPGEAKEISTGIQRDPVATALPSGSVLLLNSEVLEEAGGVKRVIGRLIDDGEPRPRRRSVRRR